VFTLIQAQTLVIQSPLKTLVTIVKYSESLANVYSTIDVNVICSLTSKSQYIVYFMLYK